MEENIQVEDKNFVKTWQEEVSDILSSKEISASPLYEEAYYAFTNKFDETHSNALNATNWEKAYYSLRAFLWVVSEINESCNPQGDFDEEKAIHTLKEGSNMLEKIEREYKE